MRLAWPPRHRGRCRRRQVRSALDDPRRRAVGGAAGERRALAPGRDGRWTARVAGSARRTASHAPACGRARHRRSLCVAGASAQARHSPRSRPGRLDRGRRSRGAAEARRRLVAGRRERRGAGRGCAGREGLSAGGGRRADVARHRHRHRCFRQRARRAAAPRPAAWLRADDAVERSASAIGGRRIAAASPARFLVGFDSRPRRRRARRRGHAGTGKQHAGDGGLGLRVAFATAHCGAGGPAPGGSLAGRRTLVGQADLSAGAWRRLGHRGTQPRGGGDRKRARLGARPVAGFRPTRLHVPRPHRRHDAHRLALGDGAALRSARRQGRRTRDAHYARRRLGHGRERAGRAGLRGRERGRRRHRGSAARRGRGGAGARCWPRRNAGVRLARQHGRGHDAAPAPWQQAAGGIRRGRSAEQLDGALASAGLLRAAGGGDGNGAAVRANGGRGGPSGAGARFP